MQKHRKTWPAYIPPRLTRLRYPFARRESWACPIEGELGATAYHESAHAVVGQVLGLNPTRVTIVADGDTLGEVSWRTRPLWRVCGSADSGLFVSWVFDDLLKTLAGPVAQGLWFPDTIDTYPPEAESMFYTADERQAWVQLQAMGACEVEIWEGVWGEACSRLEKFLNYRATRVVLGKMAALLHARGTIEADEVQSIPYELSTVLRPSREELASWGLRPAPAQVLSQLQRLPAKQLDVGLQALQRQLSETGHHAQP